MGYSCLGVVSSAIPKCRQSAPTLPVVAPLYISPLDGCNKQSLYRRIYEFERKERKNFLVPLCDGITWRLYFFVLCLQNSPIILQIEIQTRTHVQWINAKKEPN